MTIELPDEIAETLRLHAQAQGVSEAGYVRRAVEDALAEDNKLFREDTQDMPIWEVIQDITKDMPEQVFDRLPKDGASQVDHYIYGLPKRE